MIRQYIKEILIHTKNIYSFFSVFLSVICFAVLFVFPDKKDFSIYLGFFFLVLSIIVANYYAWKKLYEKFIERLKIDFRPSPIQCGFIGNGDVLERSGWWCQFDISNSSTNESYFLEKWEIEDLEFDKELISFSDSETLILKENASDRISVSTPYEIQPKTKKMLKGEIPFKFKSSGPEHFAKKINNIQTFSVVLKIFYVDLYGNKNEEKFNFTDNFEHFKDAVQSYWKKDKKYENLYLRSNQKTSA